MARVITLDELLLQLRRRQLILISESEIWPSPLFTQEIKRAIRRHRQGLKVLLRWASIDVCASRDLHRQYWRYIGNNRYECEKCKHFVTVGVC